MAVAWPISAEASDLQICLKLAFLDRVGRSLPPAASFQERLSDGSEVKLRFHFAKRFIKYFEVIPKEWHLNALSR